MSNDIIETIEYKEMTINIYPDYNYDTGMDDTMGELHCDSRDLYIGSVRKDGKEVKKPVSLKYSIAEMLDILKDSRVFYGSYGSHSGQWLNAMCGEIDAKELETLAKAQYKKDYPTKEDREYICYEDYIAELECNELYSDGLDRADVLLIIPRDLYGNKTDTPEKIAKTCWQYWDDIIRGNVYYYLIKDRDGYIVDSCGGFVGDDYIEKSAKEAIDAIDQEKHYKEKYKAEIAQHAETIKQLSQKIA